MKKILLMAAAVGAAVAPARALTASFASQEAETAVFACGFDSDEEMEGWTVAGWQLEAVPRLDQGDVKPFSTIKCLLCCVSGPAQAAERSHGVARSGGA